MREDLLRELLGQPLDQFVAARNRVARQLRADGDREAATWVTGLRRPAPYVWAIDQVAQREPSRVRGLTNLGRRLGEAQARAVQDRAAAREMQELSREVQRAVDDVVRAGLSVLREAGHGVSGDVGLSMGNALRAVLAGDEEQRVALEEGRLLAAGLPDFGFPAVPLERVVAADAAKTAEAADREVFQRRTEQRRADDRVAELRGQVQALQQDLSAAEAEARDAAERVRAAVEAARAARREADRLATRPAD